MNLPHPAPFAASLLTLEGPDALAFAHAQFTSDVLALEAGNWQWSAWLDARGQVQFLFHLARAGEDTLVALLRGGDAADMAGRLGRYVLRSRVTLSALATVPIGGGTSRPAFHFNFDGHTRSFGLGDRSLVLPAAGGEDADWRLDAIRHGEPWLPDAYLGAFLPPALGLRRLGALSLDKGCYPGQEIAARLHYRGGYKYALAHLRLPAPVAAGSSAIPAPSDAGPIAAQVLDCVPVDDAHEALAVLHLSTLEALQSASPASIDSIVLLHRFAA